MKIVKMDLKKPDLSVINEAIEVLSSGGIILYPTDTTYGLGANIFNKEAVEKIFNIKDRDYFKPISVCIYSIEEASLIAKIPFKYEKLLNSHLPGPFTFIFYKTSVIPDYFARNRKIGIRVPENIIARKLSQNFPITATSANLSGKKALKSPNKIIKQLNRDIDLVIDIGLLKSTIPSTVVDLTRKDPYILRQGSGIL